MHLILQLLIFLAVLSWWCRCGCQTARAIHIYRQFRITI